MLTWIERHPATASMTTALMALMISGVSLYISIKQQPEDPAPIIRIVEQEAILTRNNEVEQLLRLYADNAVIRDIGFGDSAKEQRRPQFWVGKTEIRKRYELIRDRAEFPELEHIHIRVFFDPSGQTASATSSTQGFFTWDGGEKQMITTINGESWSFIKVGNEWLIRDVSFHAPPSRN